MGQLVAVGKTNEIPDGEAKVITVNRKDIAVFFTDGAFFAIDDACPHAGASLAGGFVEDGEVTCPVHAWRFKLADGAWADNPRVKTGCYKTSVVGDVVFVEVP
jgi:nitrite reductase (NADH) small subunit